MFDSFFLVVNPNVAVQRQRMSLSTKISNEASIEESKHHHTTTRTRLLATAAPSFFKYLVLVQEVQLYRLFESRIQRQLMTTADLPVSVASNFEIVPGGS
jgi:hypothetical protein